MQRYEVLILAVPEITADEVKSIETQIERLVSEKKGSMISFERWGKYRLIYPVNNHEYGIYYLARFEGPGIGSIIGEVNTLLAVKLHEFVMRFMVTKLNAKESLSYQRPPSLEDTPARESSFLKESKMVEALSLPHEVESENAEIHD